MSFIALDVLAVIDWLEAASERWPHASMAVVHDHPGIGWLDARWFYAGVEFQHHAERISRSDVAMPRKVRNRRRAERRKVKAKR